MTPTSSSACGCESASSTCGCSEIIDRPDTERGSSAPVTLHGTSARRLASRSKSPARANARLVARCSRRCGCPLLHRRRRNQVDGAERRGRWPASVRSSRRLRCSSSLPDARRHWSARSWSGRHRLRDHARPVRPRQQAHDRSQRDLSPGAAPLVVWLAAPFGCAEHLRREDVPFMVAMAGGLGRVLRRAGAAVASAPNPRPATWRPPRAASHGRSPSIGLRWVGSADQRRRR